MRVFLGIPFRDDLSGSRGTIYNALRGKIESGFDFEWRETHDANPNDPFSRSATRNLIVQRALDVQADVVVINDADSLCEPTVLDAAIMGCLGDNYLHIPFETVHVCAPSKVKDAGRPGRCIPEYRYGPSCGGIYVIRPENWVLFGGQDERVRGWGTEDRITILTVKHFLGDYITHPGILWNFEHARPSIHQNAAFNAALYDSYEEAAQNGDFTAVQRNSSIFRRDSGLRP